MSRAEQMIDAVRRMEHDIQALAKDVADYSGAYHAIDRGAYHDQGRQLDATVSLTRLHVLLVQRMRSVGLGPVLAQAGTASRVSDDWVREFTSAISALVRR